MSRAVGLREYRPQRLVPGDDVRDRDLHGPTVEQTGQPDGDRDVVGRRFDVELVEEPHPLLRQRQRNVLRTLLRYQRRPAAGGDQGAQSGCEVGHRGRVEQFANGDPGVQRDAESGHELRCDERVSAQLEEVVVETHALDAQHLGVHLGDGAFDVVGRFAVLGDLECGVGQRLSVELSAGTERELGQHDQRRRHHVLRQTAA
nr:hypothetical protein [Rhodococcus fascians]